MTEELPDKFELQQCYPNPFDPITVIKFALPQDVQVRLDVFNIVGQKVGTLMDKPMEAGWHSVTFDASHLPCLHKSRYLHAAKIDARGEVASNPSDHVGTGEMRSVYKRCNPLPKQIENREADRARVRAWAIKARNLHAAREDKNPSLPTTGGACQGSIGHRAFVRESG